MRASLRDDLTAALKAQERSVAAQEYKQLGRNDLAERLRAEAEALSRYLRIRPTL